jgi:hypothetical protein
MLLEPKTITQQGQQTGEGDLTAFHPVIARDAEQRAPQPVGINAVSALQGLAAPEDRLRKIAGRVLLQVQGQHDEPAQQLGGVVSIRGKAVSQIRRAGQASVEIRRNAREPSRGYLTRHISRSAGPGGVA